MDYVDTSRNKVRLKMLGRIDYTLKRGDMREEGDEEEARRKRRARPPAKLFDPETLR